jgi:regulator of protease activity HflC (stomatin/prohibitin superfamily)
MRLIMHDQSGFSSVPPPVPPQRGRGGTDSPRTALPVFRALVGVIIAAVVIYGGYFWMLRRIVVEPGKVMVLLKKNGSHSLPGNQIIVPHPPDQKLDPDAYDKWEQEYGDCNGILEQVYLPGTYFGFSPFDYERELTDTVEVPTGKVGIVVRKFGKNVPSGILADETKDERGPLPIVLSPGQWPAYANPHAYEVKLVDPVVVDPGNRGVVTIMAGKPAVNPDAYLVNDGEQGTQSQLEPEGFRYINPYQKRVTPISIQSQQFQMSGDDSIRFPSSDSFEIKMEGFVEWSIIPDKLPLIYVQYGEGGGLIKDVEDKVILPYSRSFSRLVGSQYSARDFIGGDTKLKFQAEFESKLKEACAKQGIEILQALVRDIVPPDAIKDPINEREIAKQQINSLEQQMQVARSQAELATQEETANQNEAIGDANKAVVKIVKQAEQNRDVALTKAQQDLDVAKLQLAAAQQQADAVVARGQAEANVVLLQKQAEADPLREQVTAFGDGETYAQYFFYQKLAPSVKSILANSDGPFADVFRQFAAPSSAISKNGTKVTQAQP